MLRAPAAGRRSLIDEARVRGAHAGRPLAEAVPLLLKARL